MKEYVHRVTNEFIEFTTFIEIFFVLTFLTVIQSTESRTTTAENEVTGNRKRKRCKNIGKLIRKNPEITSALLLYT